MLCKVRAAIHREVPPDEIARLLAEQGGAGLAQSRRRPLLDGVIGLAEYQRDD